MAAKGGLSPGISSIVRGLKQAGGAEYHYQTDVTDVSPENDGNLKLE